MWETWDWFFCYDGLAIISVLRVMVNQYTV